MAFISIPPTTLSSLVCINQRSPLYWLDTEERSSSASVQRKKLGKKKPFCWLKRESTSSGKDEKKRTKKKKKKGILFLFLDMGVEASKEHWRSTTRFDQIDGQGSPAISGSIQIRTSDSFSHIDS